jgi:hypothetical protein
VLKMEATAGLALKLQSCRKQTQGGRYVDLENSIFLLVRGSVEYALKRKA